MGVKLHIWFAKSAPVALILREGPKHTYEMIKWNTKDNIFERGQWLKKKKIYLSR